MATTTVKDLNVLAVTGKGPGAGAHDGRGPLPEDNAEPGSMLKFLSILDQVVADLKFLE